MILEAILLVGLFHHKKKVDIKFEENKAYLKRAEKGLQAYLEDTRYSIFEKDDIDAFAHQLYACEQPMTSNDLDKCTDKLSTFGEVLDSVDKMLHSSNVI